MDYDRDDRLEKRMNTESYFALAGDRRSKPRLAKPFHINVQGRAQDGSSFEVATVLKNMSSSGIYLYLDRQVEVGARLALTIRLSTSENDEVPVARVAVKGIVVRTESQPNGDCGTAVAIIKRQFVN